MFYCYRLILAMVNVTAFVITSIAYACYFVLVLLSFVLLGLFMFASVSAIAIVF